MFHVEQRVELRAFDEPRAISAPETAFAGVFAAKVAVRRSEKCAADCEREVRPSAKNGALTSRA